MHTYRVWYVHRKWADICLMFMFMRHIHLKWIQEIFLAWLSLVTHERLNLYERCVAIYLYDSRDSDKYMKLSEGVNFCEILKKWYHLSILKIWKWICYNRFHDDDRTPKEILKFVDYRKVWNEIRSMRKVCLELQIYYLKEILCIQHLYSKCVKMVWYGQI